MIIYMLFLNSYGWRVKGRYFMIKITIITFSFLNPINALFRKRPPQTPVSSFSFPIRSSFSFSSSLSSPPFQGFKPTPPRTQNTPLFSSSHNTSDYLDRFRPQSGTTAHSSNCMENRSRSWKDEVAKWSCSVFMGGNVDAEFKYPFK